MNIGRKIKVITDRRRNVKVRDSELSRQLIVSIFYPMINEPLKKRRSSYLDLFSPHNESYIDIVNKDLDDVEKAKLHQHLDSIKMHFINEPYKEEHSNKYPVIIFSPGFMMDRDSSSFIIEQLVAKKFIVITLGHLHETPFTFLPNGDILESQNNQITHDDKIQLIVDRSKDIELIVELLQEGDLFHDELDKLFDTSKMCLIGHSFGGAASYKYSLNNSNIKALVLWDASLQYFDDLSEYQDYHIPVLNLRRGLCNYTDEIEYFIKANSMKMSVEECETSLEIRKKVSRMQFDSQQKLYKSIFGRKSFIKLKGSVHMSFTDFPVVSPVRDENTVSHNNKLYSMISEVTSAFLNDILFSDKNSYEQKIKEYLRNGIDMIKL